MTAAFAEWLGVVVGVAMVVCHACVCQYRARRWPPLLRVVATFLCVLGVFVVLPVAVEATTWSDDARQTINVRDHRAALAIGAVSRPRPVMQRRSGG